MPNTFFSHIKRQVARLDLRRPEPRNFLLGVINGAVFRVSMVMMDSEIVVSWFLSQLGISPQMAGVYLTARTAAAIASNLVWGRISDRKGNRRLLQAAAMLGLSMPLGALVIGAVANRMSLSPGSSALAGLSWAYGLVYAASGALMAGINIGSPGYLLGVAPPAERPLYLGFTKTLFGVVRFAAMLSGVVVEQAGFAALLGLSAGFYVLALVLSLRMVELRGQRAG